MTTKSPTMGQRRKATLVAKLCVGSVYGRTSPVRKSAEAALLTLSERALQDIVVVVNYRTCKED